MTSGCIVTVNTTNHNEDARLETSRTYEVLSGVAQNFTVLRNVRSCVLDAGHRLETNSLCECALTIDIRVNSLFVCAMTIDIQYIAYVSVP
jgi:hypothetical protein